jgi:hypothetical protein
MRAIAQMQKKKKKMYFLNFAGTMGWKKPHLKYRQPGAGRLLVETQF